MVVDGHRHEVFVQNRHVSVQVSGYLLVCQRRETVQGRECLVVHVENLHAVAFAHVFHALGLHHVYVGSFFDQVGELEHGREGRAHVQCPLGPIDLLGEAELFQHGAVISIVVEAGERAQMLETFHQKAFLVHIGESPGTAHIGASPLSAPFGHGVDQRF